MESLDIDEHKQLIEAKISLYQRAMNPDNRLETLDLIHKAFDASKLPWLHMRQFSMIFHKYTVITYYVNIYLTLYDPRGGGAIKAPPPHRFFALTHLILELHYCALGTFHKNSFNTVMRKIFLIGDHDMAVRWVSKYKVDIIFIIFREFNTMLEIVDS